MLLICKSLNRKPTAFTATAFWFMVVSVRQVQKAELPNMG